MVVKIIYSTVVIYVAFQHIQKLLEAFFQYENEVFNGELEIESTNCARVG